MIERLGRELEDAERTLARRNQALQRALEEVEALKRQDSGEDMAVVLVGYGDQVFGQQMEEYMEAIGRYLKIKTDIDTVAITLGAEVDVADDTLVTHADTAITANVIDGTMVKVFGWYDNEWGYANRCVDLIQYVGAKL